MFAIANLGKRGCDCCLDEIKVSGGKNDGHRFCNDCKCKG